MNKLLDKSHKWGVVEFNVLGDTNVALRAGIQLALSEHSSFTHFRVVTKDNGSNELHLCWGGRDASTTELPFPLKDVDGISMFIAAWLTEKGIYDSDTQGGGDGSDNEGVRLTNEFCEKYDHRTDYLALRVIPEYVYYSK